MKKIVCIFCVIFTFSISVIGQISNKPILLGKSSPYFEDQDQLYHAVESTTEMFKKDPKALVAVRVCSIDPLPVAFVNAAGIGWVIKQIEQQLDRLRDQTFSVNVPLLRIYYLRNDKGCGFYKKASLTEYWFIPSNADFPEYLEVSKAENVFERNLIYSGKIDERIIVPQKPENFIAVNVANYEIFNIALIKLLKEKKTSLLLINYPAHGAMKKVIFNNANKLKSSLIKNGIRPRRIFVKLSDNSAFYDKGEISVFPNVTVFINNSEN